jgi:ABC-type nickel/cobalt efflux system permease component RcnA
VHFVLASVEIKDVLAQWQTVSVATREVLIVTGAVVLVTVGILVCVAFLRKSGRRHHRHHHRYHDVQKPAQDTPAAEDGGDHTVRATRHGPRQADCRPCGQEGRQRSFPEHAREPDDYAK